MYTRIALFLLLLTLATPCLAETITGRVVGIQDGDTITVLQDQQTYRIRLAGIDSPEKKQPFGQVAKAYTSAQAFGRVVRVQIEGRDRYGRSVGLVELPGGQSLNQELVGSGLAWWYRSYAPKDQTLARLETEARAGRRGLACG